MKKTFLTLAIIIASYFSYAQSTFPTDGSSVGINTLSPESGFKLDVNGLGAIGTKSSARIYLGTVDATHAVIQSRDLSVNRSLLFSANDYNFSVGNVGIGTTAPQTKLHVYSTTSADGISVDGSTNPAVTLRVNGTIKGYAPGIVSSTNGFLDGSAAGDMAFRSESNRILFGIGATPSLTISSGNVGIGTTSPGAKLDVEGGTLRVGNGSGSYSGFLFNTTTGLTQENNNKVTLQGALQVNSTAGMDSYITGTGNVGIGTTNTAGYKFAVNGSAIATSMKVKLQANWPDFVFLKDYKLPTLTEVKTYIDKNQHLPDMPSADEVHKNGLDLGEMNRLLLKKVEELTLYLIDKDNQDKEKEARLQSQQTQINELKEQIAAIAKK